MSATLDSQALAQLMGNAPVVTCTGKEFPVATHYVGSGNGSSLVQHVAETVSRAVTRYDGSILAFLPGAPEIRKVRNLLDQSDLGPGCLVMPAGWGRAFAYGYGIKTRIICLPLTIAPKYWKPT